MRAAIFQPHLFVIRCFLMASLRQDFGTGENHRFGPLKHLLGEVCSREQEAFAAF